MWDLDASVRSAGGGDGLVQVRACFSAAADGSNPLCQGSPTAVQLVRTALGASYATQDLGPGSVSLLTGGYSISATDVAESGYADSLTLDRTLTTLAPAAASTAPTGVFGPGWTASLTGPAAGAAGETPAVSGDDS